MFRVVSGCRVRSGRESLVSKTERRDISLEVCKKRTCMDVPRCTRVSGSLLGLRVFGSDGHMQT